MAQDIVSGLFGLSPYQVQQQRNASLEDFAAKQAQRSLAQQATYGLSMGGGQLAQGLGGMLGMVDPAVEEAKRREAALSGIDISSPEGLLARAQATDDPRIKMQLMLLAQQQKTQQQELALKRAQELAALHKAQAEASPYAKIDPSKFTPESMKLYVAGGARDPSVLVAIEKDDTPSTEVKTVERAAIANGLKKGTPEFEAYVKNALERMQDKRTHITVAGGVSGGEAPTKEEVDYYAEMAMAGDQSWRIGLGRSKDGAALIRAVDRRMPELAKEVGMKPGDVVANKQEVATRVKALRDFSTGKQGQAINSFNTAIDHLATLEQLGEALKNGDMQVINRVGNTVAQWTGQPAPTEFNAAKNIVGQEIVKAIVAGGGGVTERMEAAKQISDANSPAQLVGVIKTYKKLMAGQLSSLGLQYEQTTKRKDFADKLSPEAKKLATAHTPTAAPKQDGTAMPLDAYLKSKGY